MICEFLRVLFRAFKYSASTWWHLNICLYKLEILRLARYTIAVCIAGQIFVEEGLYQPEAGPVCAKLCVGTTLSSDI